MHSISVSKLLALGLLVSAPLASAFIDGVEPGEVERRYVVSDSILILLGQHELTFTREDLLLV